MDYCIDLLESAARHHLLVNFHGATVPRGWQRTWPNLVSTEGVYGAEWYNNVPTFTAQAARHNATLPFTRNVIGPMDYTPCAFSDSQHPHITSNAHELALTVLYESTLQHLADKPESYYAQPQQVQDFFGQLPTVWDETRFVSGYPGESVVLARRNGNTWYVAGINGRDEALTLNLDLSFIPGSQATVFADAANKPWDIHTVKALPTEMALQPRGGFVLVIPQSFEFNGKYLSQSGELLFRSTGDSLYVDIAQSHRNVSAFKLVKNKESMKSTTYNAYERYMNNGRETYREVFIRVTRIRSKEYLLEYFGKDKDRDYNSNERYTIRAID